MTDAPDDDLAQALADSCEQRIAAQIAAAQQRTATNVAARAAFAENRQHGLTARHAAKTARIRLAAHHMLPTANPAADTTTKENPVTDTIRAAHAETLARLPQRCHDCGATDTDLYLAYVSGGIGEVLYCPHCAEHPEHQHGPNCPN